MMTNYYLLFRGFVIEINRPTLFVCFIRETGNEVKCHKQLSLG